jgi:putative ABC transport system ATP-binding protein
MSTPILELRTVTKVFGRDEAAVTALDGIDLAISEGEIIVVTGPSGSGKTTLLQVGGGLLSPTTGVVAIDGEPLEGMSSRRLARVRAERVGFVFQAFNLFSSLSAEANVRLPLSLLPAKARHPERVGALIRDLGLDGRRRHLPSQLSGGQQQRLAIARALVNDPALILADEPTGNLDSRSGFAVLHQLERLARDGGKALVVVTHDFRITQVADRVLWLEDGRWGPAPTEAEMAIDVVCGMSLPVDRAAAARTVEGRTLYFCSDICVEKFDRAPEGYLGGRVGVRRAP